ncbi:4'-phosphopantetheinyl transferase family protein [Streptomyces sp. RKAG337]|uniref:4'-phosphopantetheinyl transferase family protein n=1 Tax=Streptomyces sp. RKAG337 TaxID=2893404 RepID=UPI002033AE2C|nr:4'-phosphopantetheinyl transferase superfamily protein [Streptomyces sp. RKAG337]MCM2426998.1 4'-phosphopantetheinyl transferase superfamily protein [Streptomyces sp. RKAG337]
MLEGLLPVRVAVAEVFGDPPHTELFPEEHAVVAGALDARRREFAGVRRCARTAMARLGMPPVPILPRGEGPGWARYAPCWPDGTVGSMTHCKGYRAAAVAGAADVASVGIDAEPHAPLPEGLHDVVTLPEERRTLTRLAAAHPGVAWERVVFSAKESVFKAWYPLTGRWLGFHDCVVTPDPDRETFTATLRIPGPVVSGVRVGRFTGRWRILEHDDGGWVGTAVTVGGPPDQ